MHITKPAPELEEEKSPGIRKTVAVAVVIAFLLMGNVYLLSRVNRAQVTTSTLRENTQKDIARLEEQLAFRSVQANRDLEAVHKELDKARRDADKQAKKQASNYTERLSRKMSERQRQQQETLLSEIQGLHDMASQTESKISGVSGDVTEIKTDVEQTKSKLDEALLALEGSQDRLEAVGDWVASNSEEIGILQELTERKYFAFNLVKSDKMYRVGDIHMRLKRVKPKHHQYTMELLADDQKFTKKARQANEPVQFYVSGARQPHEIVITAVKENRVVGYLSAPKSQLAHN